MAIRIKEKRMVVFDVSERVILGTRGEDALKKALRFYVRYGDDEDTAKECDHLLAYLGERRDNG
jgi:hypothetical protein